MATLPDAQQIEFIRLLEREAAEQAKDSLACFIRQAWQVIEPTTPLIWGWHLDAICDHLEAVSRRQIRNLVIEVPPRSSKSTICSVLWPAWEWLHRPQTRFLTASYALNLAIRDALRTRRVITSAWFRERWGGAFDLTGDQNVKSRYENDRTGYRIALSVDSGTTGEGGDITLIDDGHNVTEAESEAVCKATICWHDEAFFNRLNDAKTGARVIIGQRVGVNDLIGHVLARGGWEELRIPEEFEAASRCTTSIGWTDPRTEEGELLRPERFGPEQVAEAKKTLGSIAYASQHQQRPVPREGALFKAPWIEDNLFRFVPPSGFEVNGQFVHKDDCFWFATVDPAGGVSEHADHTAIGIFAVTPSNRLLVVHVDRSRTPIEDIVPHLQSVVMGWPLSYICIEGAFLQKRLVVEPAQRAKGLPPIRLVLPTGGKGERGKGNKYLRAVPSIIAMESGQIHCNAGATWLDAFSTELLRFTGKDGEPSDQVDMLSYAVAEWEQGEYGVAEPLILGQKPDNFGAGGGVVPGGRRG